jgi:hypothetical protein
MKPGMKVQGFGLVDCGRTSYSSTYLLNNLNRKKEECLTFDVLTEKLIPTAV